jgi:hypothetical protein
MLADNSFEFDTLALGEVLASFFHVSQQVHSKELSGQGGSI